MALLVACVETIEEFRHLPGHEKDAAVVIDVDGARIQRPPADNTVVAFVGQIERLGEKIGFGGGWGSGHLPRTVVYDGKKHSFLDALRHHQEIEEFKSLDMLYLETGAVLTLEGSQARVSGDGRILRMQSVVNSSHTINLEQYKPGETFPWK